MAAVAEGAMGLADCEVVPATPGDILLVRAGTIHAIGAGILVYEIEQPSDLTYRISDWGRPAVPGRTLHPEEAVRAIRPELRAETVGRGWHPEGGALAVPEFRLEVCGEGPTERRPGGDSVEVVTVLHGEATATGDGWSEKLVPFETLVVPASVERYAIEGGPGSISCVGSIP
jgi:mannose-6-phosphate isomerase